LGSALEKEDARSKRGVADDNVPLGIGQGERENKCDEDEAEGELEMVKVKVPPVGAVEGEAGGVGFEEAVKPENVLD